MAMNPKDTSLPTGQRQPTQRTLGARWNDRRTFTHEQLAKALTGLWIKPKVKA